MTIAIPRLDRAPAAERGITLADFLVPISVAERVAPRWRHIALILVGTLFVTLCAQIYIPTEPVPFTGQTFGVLVVGGALGFRRGASALLLYLVIGAIGLPVFAEGTSGVRPSFGYIVGFVVAAGVVGRLAELGWDRRIVGSLTSMLIGTAIIYAFGVPWLKAAADLSWADAIAFGLTPFLLWDAAKLMVAGALFPAAWYAIGRRPDDR
jgi:biotin transport system substrate-specific component